MARPKSDERKRAIMQAAIRVIDQQGLSAPTAVIAREAGVSNGSLFTYFETKAALFNELYIELKAGMASAALEGSPAGRDQREHFLHVWSNWMRWAVQHPEQRRALALLGVADELTSASREKGHEIMAGIAALIEQGRANGPLRDAPFAFVAALMEALAETTMDFMLADPTHAEAHCRAGFDALWRMLS